MREVLKYEAFDGVLFDTKLECEEYEKNHVFLNPNEIKFYSLNGKKIKGPCESVFIDANRFVVFNEEALTTFIEFRRRLKLKAPELPTMEEDVDYPLHYVFKNNDWLCYEDFIAILKDDMLHEFTSEYEENEEDRHNLADNG